MGLTPQPRYLDPGSALRSLGYKEYIGELIEYLRYATKRLQVGQKPDSPEDGLFIRDVTLVLETLADSLDPTAQGAYSLRLAKREKGRPSGLRRMSAIEVLAVTIVLRCPEGEKKEAAIQEAMQRTGLSRPKVFQALRRFRETEADLDHAISLVGSWKKGRLNTRCPTRGVISGRV